MGLRKHSDNNLLTLMLQDSTPGLQVKKGGQWITVKPAEGWFVVNVGNQIEILSNGRYRSAEHRAFVSSKPRICELKASHFHRHFQHAFERDGCKSNPGVAGCWGATEVQSDFVL